MNCGSCGVLRWFAAAWLYALGWHAIRRFAFDRFRIDFSRRERRMERKLRRRLGRRVQAGVDRSNGQRAAALCCRN
jgi:hypothetical protein